MSLGIVFKGPEGIVLAADSRVTLTARNPESNLVHNATFDNATKMLQVADQQYVGAVTYGLGGIGIESPRMTTSFLPEFEDELTRENGERLSVGNFAEQLSQFFMNQWNLHMPSDYTGPPVMFLVGGYDDGQPYGRVFEFSIPQSPAPLERYPETGSFGITYGGQREYVDRLTQGFDDSLPGILKERFSLSDSDSDQLRQDLRQNLALRIPYQFLPLQDCVDLSIFLIRTTISIQDWIVGVRGVGGEIDVATVTRTEGFKPVQRKLIHGEE